LKKILKPHQNIVDEVKDFVFQNIRQNIRNIDPEIFYLKFDTIEQELRADILQTLFALGLKEDYVISRYKK